MPDHPLSFPDMDFQYYALADGARLRYAVIEPKQPPRGTFVIAEGRREFIEKKYLEAGVDLLARGFRVILFDWRGQGLSTRFLGGADYQRDHVTDFSIYINDLSAFYRDIVKPCQTGPLLILAHSLGGLITTRWLAENPREASAVKAFIMTAPALVIGVPPLSHGIARGLARLGFGDHYAAGQHDYDDHDRKFEHNVLSHDRERFGVIEKYFDANPALRVGGVTWDWLREITESIKTLRQPGYLENITLPVLTLVGGRDIVTPAAKIVPLIRRMPNAEAVLIPGARHDLINEADRYRLDAWRHIDAFLNRVIRG